MSGGKVVVRLVGTEYGNGLEIVDEQAINLRMPVGEELNLVLQSDLAAAIARAEAAERDAARLAFCVEHDVFPVRDNGGVQWVMFVAVKSTRRSLFIGDTPAEAIDAAMAAEGRE